MIRYDVILSFFVPSLYSVLWFIIVKLISQSTTEKHLYVMQAICLKIKIIIIIYKNRFRLLYQINMEFVVMQTINNV